MELISEGGMMKIYLISQNKVSGYDTYSDAVVCAEDEESAKKINPDSYYPYDEETKTFHWGTKEHQYEPESLSTSWVSVIEDVEVEYLGEAKPNLKKGIICSSFHAG